MMGVLNDQKTRTFSQYLSNAAVQNFNDFLNKRERGREGERERERERGERENERIKVTMIFVLNRMKNN